MEILRHVVVYAHIVSFAVLFGSWLVEATGTRRSITRLMHIGMTFAAITGLALAAPWGIDGSLNYAKIGTKLVILLAIGALLGIGSARQRKTNAVPPALFWSIGALTLINAGIAVLWR